MIVSPVQMVFDIVHPETVGKSRVHLTAVDILLCEFQKMYISAEYVPLFLQCYRRNFKWQELISRRLI